MPTPRQASSPRDAIFHLLRVSLQEHGQRWTELLSEAPHGGELTKPQYAILRAIEAHPGLDQAAAGEFTGTDKATVTVLLDRLAGRELITRQVHPQDRRRRRLLLTERGRRLLDALTPVMDRASAELLARLTAEERAQLLVLLRKLSNRG